jgi:hypothetical protein
MMSSRRSRRRATTSAFASTPRATCQSLLARDPPRKPTGGTTDALALLLLLPATFSSPATSCPPALFSPAVSASDPSPPASPRPSLHPIHPILARHALWHLPSIHPSCHLARQPIHRASPASLLLTAPRRSLARKPQTAPGPDLTSASRCRTRTSRLSSRSPTASRARCSRATRLRSTPHRGRPSSPRPSARTRRRWRASTSSRTTRTARTRSARPRARRSAKRRPRRQKMARARRPRSRRRPRCVSSTRRLREIRVRIRAHLSFPFTSSSCKRPGARLKEGLQGQVEPQHRVGGGGRAGKVEELGQKGGGWCVSRARGRVCSFSGG